MTRLSKLAPLALFLLLAAACAGGESKETAGAVAQPSAKSADEAVMRVARGLADGKPETLWQALPASYQKDVTELVRGAAAKIDPDLWQRTFDVLGKLSRVLSEKREYILNHPMVASQLTNPREAYANWDAVVGLFDTVVQSDLADLEKMSQLDVEAFLAATGGALMQRIGEASAMTADDAWGKAMDELRATKASIVAESGDAIVVRVETAGKPPQEEPWVQVEGKWIPERMALEWQDEIARARESVAAFSGEQQPENKRMTLMQLAMAEGALDTILAAKNAEEFNQSLGGVLGVAMSAASHAVPPGVTETANPDVRIRELPDEPPARVDEAEPAMQRVDSRGQSDDPQAVPLAEARAFIGQALRVEGRDGLDFTGELVAVDGGVLRFVKHYRSGDATFSIGAGEIRSLRFAR